MNEKIRQTMKDNGIMQWEVAKIIGITEGTLIRWLRDDPLPEEHRQKIEQAIMEGRSEK